MFLVIAAVSPIILFVNILEAPIWIAVAAEYQIIVYLMIIGGGIITALLVSYLSRKRLFNDAEQLEDWI